MTGITRGLAGVALLLQGARADMSREAYSSEAAQFYNPTMTRAFAALSTLSYCPGTEPRVMPKGFVQAVERNCGDGEGSWCKAAGFTVKHGSVKKVMLPDLNQNNSIFAMVAKWTRQPGGIAKLHVPEPEGCVIAIRGSIGPNPFGANWQRSYDTAPVEPKEWKHCKNCKVSGGPYKMWNVMKEDVLKKLEANGCTAPMKSAIFVTGHSLGAHLSYMAMYELKSMGFNVLTSYIFASPRPGNTYFTTAFTKLFKHSKVPLYHVNHGLDRAPVNPDNERLFRHPPFQVFYRGEGSANYTVCYDPADTTCGTYKYKRSELASQTLPPQESPHCKLPEAPYANFCQFSGNGWIFYMGPWNFLSVCENGGYMPYYKPQPAGGIFNV